MLLESGGYWGEVFRKAFDFRPFCNLAHLEYYQNKALFFQNNALQCYHALVHTFLSYGITIWEATYPVYVFKRLKFLQNRAIRTVARFHYRDQENPYHIHLKILQIDDLLSKIAKFVHCCITNVLIGNYFCKIVEHSGPRHLDATNLT